MKSRVTWYVFLAFALLMAGCGPLKAVAVSVADPEYWPTAGWQNSTPETQGMNSELLAQMLADISAKQSRIYSVLIIRNGYMVTEAYFHPYAADTKVHVQSVTKSVIGMLVGKAIYNGYIKNEDEKLTDFFPDRVYENANKQKSAIRLKHLLSMASGLNCQEFSSGPHMEQTEDWTQFMLDLPVTGSPGKDFGYCNGNAHLLSSILSASTGMSAREYANRELFQLLGLSPVSEADWPSDPQGFTMGGYGLHLKPVDLAKLAFLSLHNGQWDGEQIIPEAWVAASTAEQVQKGDGSAYGYLWTVYPGDGHYAALGLGGQQIHVYPSRNLIVVVTASLESYAEALEIESMLNDYILPAIQADGPLAENTEAYARLQAEIETAAHPIQDVPKLPTTALDVSGSTYSFGENPFGWETLGFQFEPGALTAQILFNEFPLHVGLDHIYRVSDHWSGGEILLRGRWQDENTFILDYPYPMDGFTVLGELGATEFQIEFHGDEIVVTEKQLVFGGEPVIFKGTR